MSATTGPQPPPTLAAAAATEQAAAVTVQRLQVRRGRRLVIDGLDLDVPARRVTGLLGPNGCGKTTLIRAIMGVQRTDAGRVTVLGHPAGSRALRGRVGYLTQSPSVYGDLTVRENITYFAAVTGVPRRLRRGHVDGLLERLALTGQAGQLAADLSGGQTSRVSLAAAMVGSPELLVLDEPTVGLDPLLRQEVWGLLRALAGAGTSVLISSHVMDEAARCDELLLLRDGRLLAHGSLPQLLAQTGAADVEGAYIAAVLAGAGAP